MRDRLNIWFASLPGIGSLCSRVFGAARLLLGRCAKPALNLIGGHSALRACYWVAALPGIRRCAPVIGSLREACPQLDWGLFGAARLLLGRCAPAHSALGYRHSAHFYILHSTFYILHFFLFLLTLTAIPSSAQIVPSFGSDRAGTSGFQFLKIPVDARSAAMGQAVVANAFDASSTFWNPALTAQNTGFQLGANHTAYFADVSLDFFAASFHLAGPRITLGASLQSMNSGEMDVTTEFQPFGTGETFRSISMAGGLTFSQQLTDLFSYGVTTKLVRENVAEIVTNTVVFDLGIFYRVGTTGAQVAVAIRNFGLDGTPSGEIDRIAFGEGIITEDEFERITPPTTFLLGLTYTLFQANTMNDLIVSAQLNNPNDNAESLNFGAEYTWNSLLMLRTGYQFGIDEYTLPSAGAGIMLPLSGPELRFDYGFSRLERLGNVHRVSLNVAL